MFFFSHGDSKSAGVSVMFRNGFDFKVNDSILDHNGLYYFRFNCLWTTFNTSLFLWLQHWQTWIANTSFLFCGDWDVVQNKSDDTYNVIHDRNQNARKK